MTRDRVEAALHQARSAGVSYPTYASMLAAAGVRRYHTDVATHTTTYAGDTGSFQESSPAVASPGSRRPTAFAEAGVREAIAANQRGETDYATFLRQIWEAGVTHYDVDLTARVITYAGVTGRTYIEQIPAAPPR